MKPIEPVRQVEIKILESESNDMDRKAWLHQTSNDDTTMNKSLSRSKEDIIQVEEAELELNPAKGNELECWAKDGKFLWYRGRNCSCGIGNLASNRSVERLEKQ